jgi:hypothetical protein
LVLYSLLQLFAILSVPKALSKYSIGVRLSVSNPLSRRWMQVVDPGDLAGILRYRKRQFWAYWALLLFIIVGLAGMAWSAWLLASIRAGTSGGNGTQAAWSIRYSESCEVTTHQGGGLFPEMFLFFGKRRSGCKVLLGAALGPYRALHVAEAAGARTLRVVVSAMTGGACSSLGASSRCSSR